MNLEQSRRALLDSLNGATDITLCRMDGNLGDHLIDAGAEVLLAGVTHRTVWRQELGGRSGDLLIVQGGGGWCRWWLGAVCQVFASVKRFHRIVVFPSTFDARDPLVRRVLETARASPLFAREKTSLRLASEVRDDVILAHDTSFFVDYRPYERKGAGVLRAFRRDPEKGPEPVPEGSVDISAEALDLDEWLNTIADASEVETDRGHVMIAAALMGKRVRYREGAYFKLGALAETWLGDYDVEPL